MTLTRVEFGRALGEQLDTGYDPVRLANWAYRMHLDADRIEAGLEAEILKVIAMGEGSEFELSESELRSLSAILQAAQ